MISGDVTDESSREKMLLVVALGRMKKVGEGKGEGERDLFSSATTRSSSSSSSSLVSGGKKGGRRRWCRKAGRIEEGAKLFFLLAFFFSTLTVVAVHIRASGRRGFFRGMVGRRGMSTEWGGGKQQTNGRESKGKRG